jgi:hypothetical protein
MDLSLRTQELYTSPSVAHQSLATQSRATFLMPLSENTITHPTACRRPFISGVSSIETCLMKLEDPFDPGGCPDYLGKSPRKRFGTFLLFVALLIGRNYVLSGGWGAVGHEHTAMDDIKHNGVHGGSPHALLLFHIVLKPTIIVASFQHSQRK